MRFAREINVRDKGETLQYYSQKEIDNLDTNNHLFALKTELKKYIDYINTRKKDINKIREKKADNIPGTIDIYKPLIDSVNKNFNYFKTNINKLSYNSLDKDIFKIQNKIKTFHARN